MYVTHKMDKTDKRDMMVMAKKTHIPGGGGLRVYVCVMLLCFGYYPMGAGA